jgi:hypothetical protein
MAFAFVGLLVVSCFLILALGFMFAKVVGTLHTVKLEPERVDQTPIMKCQECGAMWIEDTEPWHYDACAVAYVKGETRRLT